MKSKKTIQNILITLFVGVALLVGYSLLNQGEGNRTSVSSLTSAFTSTSSVNDTQVQLANSEILRILGSIQNIKLDDDIFSNPVFRDLRDTRFTIPKPLQIGRPNPFLPIGFDDVTIQTVVQEPEVVEEPQTETFFPAGQEV